MSKALALALVLVLTVSCSVTFLPVKAEAQTIHVPDDYSTIQTAINMASAGDTIFVRNGIYKEQTLRINKPLSLIGEDAVTTRITLSPPWIEYENPIPFQYSQIPHFDDAIRIEANDVKLSGFTINNTITSNGGLCVVTGSRVQVVGNIILKNVFHFSGGYEVFALNTVTSGVEFFGGYGTIAGNTMVGGSIWIGIGCQGTVIYGNTLDGDTEGISVGGNANIVANNTVKNSKFGVGVAADASNNTLYSNTVINNTVGLRIAVEGGNNTFYSNYVANNSFGVEAQYYFPLGDNNTLFRNSFVCNTKQVYTDPFYVWGDGTQRTAYLGGYFDNGKEGNYWSDYTGVDADGDGVGDSPYLIDASRRDSCPRMIPFAIASLSLKLPEWVYLLPYPLPAPLPLPILEVTPPEEPTSTTAPEIKILTPANQTYNEPNVSIVFTVDKPLNWTGYSLNEEGNVTVTGNFTLISLPNGIHNVTVYANDTLGNMGVSETIIFTVAVPELEPEPFPVLPVAAVSVAGALVAAALLVYLKRRKLRVANSDSFSQGNHASQV